MTRNNFKIIFRSLWLIIALVATYLTLADHIVAFGGDGRPVALFFTTWSVWTGLAAAILCLIFTLQKKEESGWIHYIKFTADLMLIATFIMSAFVLPEKIWLSSYWTAGGIFKHFLLPIFTVADLFLFDEKGKYHISFPVISLALPLVFWATVIIRALLARTANCGAISSELWPMYYPYGFTNLDNGHSLGGLCGLLAGIMCGLVLIGYGLYFVKRTKK